MDEPDTWTFRLTGRTHAGPTHAGPTGTGLLDD